MLDKAAPMRPKAGFCQVLQKKETHKKKHGLGQVLPGPSGTGFGRVLKKNK